MLQILPLYCTKQDNGMMKKSILNLALILSLSLSPLALAASNTNSNINLPKEQGVVYRDAFGNTTQNSNVDLNSPQTTSTANEQKDKIAIIYFSPTEEHTSEVDGLSGATLIYNEKTQEQEGLVLYIAKKLATKLNQAQIFKLDKDISYPKEHKELINLSAQEADEQTKINIKLEPNLDLSTYQTIIIGFPIWWQDMPRVFYALFENFDFSGKTIIPFCLYNSSYKKDLFSTIEKLEPNATVISKHALGIKVDQINNIPALDKKIEQWLNIQGLTKDSIKVSPINKDVEPSSPKIKLQ